MEIPPNLQRRYSVWVGHFEKNRGKQKKQLPELSPLIDLTQDDVFASVFSSGYLKGVISCHICTRRGAYLHSKMLFSIIIYYIILIRYMQFFQQLFIIS